MHRSKPLPAYLVTRYHGWRATTFAENRAWYRRLATEGQRPRAMVVTCCDSRVHAEAILGADEGEFFIHRNIAALIPPHEPDGQSHGTSAALEYAVTGLRVSHILVLGHSNCGGVAGCHAMCSGAAPELEEATSYVGRWMDILRPGYERWKAGGGTAEDLRTLEKEAVTVSIRNLVTFPFVEKAVSAGELSFHGLWMDLAEGQIEVFDPAGGRFAAI